MRARAIGRRRPSQQTRNWSVPKNGASTPGLTDDAREARATRGRRRWAWRARRDSLARIVFSDTTNGACELGTPILFTDFVGSTKQLSALGDQAWRNLLDSHDVIARTAVEQHGGHLVNTTGDGILATFDGPGRAIRCATALGDALQPLGIEIRSGLHTGEVERRGAEITGIAVHIAARVLEAAAGGELLVSPAVPMLVAGSGFEFEDRGEHELKGVPGTWQLYAVKPWRRHRSADLAHVAMTECRTERARRTACADPAIWGTARRRDSLPRHTRQ
jgi:class 3 adenylate cyclase